MNPHICKQNDNCICYTLADEPNEQCPVHGSIFKPRCGICGQFMKPQYWTQDMVDNIKLNGETLFNKMCETEIEKLKEKTPVILFRNLALDCRDTLEEIQIASKYFPLYKERTSVPPGSIVIGRYSVLPFYQELEKDLIYLGSNLINTYHMHQWIASFDWYFSEEELQQHTPKTWKENDIPYIDEKGPYIVKGCTNSKKQLWNSHMFAKDKKSLMNVIFNLRQDSFIDTQDLLIRKYEPLKTFEIGINDLPFTNEWRFFFLGNNILSYGYYWSILDDMTKPYITNEAVEFAEKIASIVSKNVNFFVLDIAETEDGKWILIEINDGQMSGLSLNSPDNLYLKMYDWFKKGTKNEKMGNS